MASRRANLFTAIVGFCLTLLLAPLALADETSIQNRAKQIWQVLDYLAVDYGAAVSNGQIIEQAEYVEMQEFSQNAERQLSELAPFSSKDDLVQQAGQLRTLIAEKASPKLVANKAREIAAQLVAVYPVPMSPSTAPVLGRGEVLYAAQCASCHGAQGHGDGPLAASLSPPPIAFSDRDRAQERSVFALYQIISSGVDSTAMPDFAHITDDDRWALAYFSSTLSYTAEEVSAGGQQWLNNQAVRSLVPNLDTLTQITEISLAQAMDPSAARHVLAFLRSEPAVVMGSSSDSLGLAKTKLAESIRSLEQGDVRTASTLALSAYLDGFEIAEPALAAKDKSLFDALERSMGAYRVAVNRENLLEAQQLEKDLQRQLATAQSRLGQAADDPVATFLGAFTILLREGVEALLIVVAMVAFLKKAQRKDVLPYVHTGWIAALLAGVATWGVATYLVDLSGASREMTEGFAAIFAAVVLLCVGIWMHQKSMAGRWQQYVKEKLSAALNRKSALMLFLLSFVTVYREVFETVLFFAALWTGGNGAYLLLGMGAAILVLIILACVLLRTSAKLPIGQFFAASSALIGLLSVVLIGKGVAALQKVGIFDITPVAAPQIDLLGIYPSMQTLVAQLLIVLVIAISVGLNIRSQGSRPKQVGYRRHE
ncbi:FTR1 family protein [Limnobacter sp.]|uniref:FTR1 family protein n=1 Tax=Limnobacter sp. TaxID=2003368 RepID=UPI002FE31759